MSERDWPYTSEPGGCDCRVCGHIFIGSEWDSVCRVCARGMEARSGETAGLDPKGDSPVGLPTRPEPPAAAPQGALEDARFAGDLFGVLFADVIDAATQRPKADDAVEDARDAALRKILREELALALARQAAQPLGEPIEWELADGTARTTDAKVARNWAVTLGTVVVRRATIDATIDAATQQEKP